ncbi:hypothetical protein [Phormidesmis priestleyi]
MTPYPYLNIGEGLPLAPILPVIITPPDWANNLTTSSIEAFLDTGSDCTLIPLKLLSILQLRLIETNAIINGVGGGTIRGFACYVNIQLAQELHKAIRVYGCPNNQLGDRVLLGRDLLNQCCIEFDGRKLVFQFNDSEKAADE